MLPGSEFVRTGDGQWTKLPGSGLTESILHRNLSRELGLSLCAETINNGDGKFFPPTTASQRILASRSESVPFKSTVNSLAEVTSSILKVTDPARDEYKLFTRSRQPALPKTAAEQTKTMNKAPAFPLPSVPWNIDGKDKSFGANEVPAEEIQAALFAAANRAVIEKSALKFERLLQLEAVLEQKKAAALQPLDPVVLEPEELLPKFCPLNPNLPDEFKNMSVNRIFEICYNRCLQKGRAEAEERARRVLETALEDTEDEKSVSSIISSDACSEDLLFISSANILSMRKREIERAHKKQVVVDAELGITNTPPSSAGSPEEDSTLDVGELSFASRNSDPGQGDEIPLFTIRSKKEPIKIVDPKTLQRPDKPKSPKDLANDVEFLKRGLRVLSAGAELTSRSYQLFKIVAMDGTILAQTSEWCRYIREFVRATSGTLQNVENLKKAEMRSAIFEQVGQCMGHKKKMDNSILGWTNFAISMFPVDGYSDEKESPPESSEGVRLEDQVSRVKASPKIMHSHNKACRDLNHELEKLTEDNKLKFKTLLGMLIESLNECKDWIIKAPSYAKAKPLRYTELKPVEGFLVPSIEAEAPGEMKQGKQAELVAKQKISEHANVSENENVRMRTTVQEVEVKEHIEPGLSAELNQQAYYHAQLAVSWYQSAYMMHGYGQQGRSSGEYTRNTGGQALRPLSAVNQQINNDGYYQGQHHGEYQREITNRQMHRSQHNISRGRQGTRSGGQSRQSSTAGSRQTYGNPHPVSHGTQQFQNFNSSTTSEYLYNPETSAYQEIRYPYSQTQGVHQQPVLQHPQPWRMIGNGDGYHLESSRSQQFPQSGVNSDSTPDMLTTSEEYMRQDRTTTHAAPSQQQRSMTASPQMMRHPGMVYGGNDQYGGSHGIAYSQGGSGVFSVYGYTAWHSHNGHLMQQSQQQAVQGCSGKSVMYQQYSHHPGQYI